MHMIFWGDKPFARLCLALICGILFARYMPFYGSIVYLFTGIIFLVFILSTYNPSRFREHYTGILLIAFVLISGYTRCIMVHPEMDKSHYSHFINNGEVFIHGEIISIPKKTTRYSSFLKVHAAGNHIDSLNKATGKMAAYFKLEDTVAKYYRPGDEILIQGYASSLRKSRNPYAFDFNDYLKTKHVYHRLDIRPSQHHNTKRNLANPIEKMANSIRSHSLKTFNKYLSDKNHKSLANAMVLGFRNNIDPNLYNSYTNTGAIHVLAVSGLHVGILCQFLLFFLNKVFSSSNKGKVIKLSTLTISVIVYVIITGASAAVMRASVMIIIYYIGKYWADRVNNYNVLSIAAFLLLIYDPYMLFQASFQFSFLALLSIMYFYRKVYDWPLKYLEIKSRILNYLWQMIALSISAQIFVAPLTIYYFHKFPFYFWLSGMVAVPAAYAVLILGILMIIMEAIAPAANTIIDFTLTNIFDLFIYSIQKIERLPFATFEQLWIYKHELILLNLALLIFLAGRQAKKTNYIIVSLVPLLLFVCSKNYFNIKTNHQSNITIYDNYKGHVIDIFDGEYCYNLHSGNIEKRTLEFITGNNRINRKTKIEIDLSNEECYENKSIIKTKNLIQFKEESILILDSNYVDQNKTIKVNTAIILGGMQSRMDSIQKYVKSNQWIITQSEEKYKDKKWINWCNQNNEKCISIQERGAYSKDI